MGLSRTKAQRGAVLLAHLHLWLQSRGLSGDGEPAPALSLISGHDLGRPEGEGLCDSLGIMPVQMGTQDPHSTHTHFPVHFPQVPTAGQSGVIAFAQRSEQSSEGLTATWKGMLLSLVSRSGGERRGTVWTVSGTHDVRHVCGSCCLGRGYTKTWRGISPPSLIPTSLPNTPR